MKSLFIEKTMKYDGSQLRTQFAYFDYNLLGTSVVAWQGPCEIPFELMLDGEDFLARSEIRGSDMLHFIIEVFHQNLFSGVLMQRLFTNLVKEEIEERRPEVKLHRSGDDLYFEKRKLSISIATQSQLSTLIHFAVNVSREGTPVPTVGLDEWRLPPRIFAENCMERLKNEYTSILEATYKVRSV